MAKPTTRPKRTTAALLEEEAFLGIDLADRRRDTTHTRQARLERNDRLRKANLPREGATGSWITTPPKAVITERKSAGWQKDSVYFGTTTHDGTPEFGPVEPDRTHQKVGITIQAGFTARIDNPDAKQLRDSDGKQQLPYRAWDATGRLVAEGTLPWG